jgi:hypothetical protein
VNESNSRYTAQLSLPSPTSSKKTRFDLLAQELVKANIFEYLAVKNIQQFVSPSTSRYLLSGWSQISACSDPYESSLPCLSALQLRRHRFEYVTSNGAWKKQKIDLRDNRKRHGLPTKKHSDISASRVVLLDHGETPRDPVLRRTGSLGIT